MAESTSLQTRRPGVPGPDVDFSKMPGHWVLANMGKKVLRPGGRRLTTWMHGNMAMASYDRVVEFAPGLGTTARYTLRRRPASYTAVEQDKTAAEGLKKLIGNHPKDKVVIARAEETGLPDHCATMVYGEAILTMQSEAKKRAMVKEALRLLEPGGKYGIHELCLYPDNLSDSRAQAIRKKMSQTIHVNAQPLTVSQWQALLKEEGFEVLDQSSVKMSLLKPLRVVYDEGLWGAVRFLFNVLTNSKARQRVAQMRKIFGQYHKNLGGVSIIARKPKTSSC